MIPRRGAFVVAFLTLATLVASAALAAATAPTTTTSPTTQPVAAGAAAIVQLYGDIDDTNRDALVRRFEQARKLGATTVILDLDTYGGLVTSGLEISQFLKRQDDLHVI